MTKSFFEKLKKGMNIEDLIEENGNLEEINLEENNEQKEKNQEKERNTEKKSNKKKKQNKKKIKIKKEKTEKKDDLKGKSSFIEKLSNEKEKIKGELVIDLYQTEKEIVIRVPIAGVNPEELDISIENDMVQIQGERKEPEENQKEFIIKECFWGLFSREIILPEEVDASRTKAYFKNGILTIRMPKIEKYKKRKIIIKSEE